MEQDERGFILGIYNYCDRWCERCPLPSRCRVYAMETAVQIDGVDGALARAAESLPEDPPGAWTADEIWAEAAEDFSEEEYAQAMLERDVADALIEVHPLTEAADRLAALAQPLLDAADARAAAGGQEAEAFRDPLEVLAHYRHFVVVKVRRALSGRERPPILDDDGHPFPSDADGSAKIAFLACAAARDAARRLAALDPELTSLAAPYLQTAARVLDLIDEAFPGHRAFRRPGLDDPP